MTYRVVVAAADAVGAVAVVHAGVGVAIARAPSADPAVAAGGSPGGCVEKGKAALAVLARCVPAALTGVPAAGAVVAAHAMAVAITGGADGEVGDGEVQPGPQLRPTPERGWERRAWYPEPDVGGQRERVGRGLKTKDGR